MECSRCLVVCCSVKILSEDQKKKMTRRIASYVCCLVVLLLLLLLLKLFKSTHYSIVLFYSILRYFAPIIKVMNTFTVNLR